jgi:Kdo2-lipid IVA lauroyltransferase/acyltransferase
MAAPKPTFWQDLAWRLEALAFRTATGLARSFPMEKVSDFGAGFFRRLGPLTSARRVAERNMRIAFPEASDAEIQRLMRAQWEELGRWFAEFPILDRIVADPARVEVEGAERLAAIADGAGPVVFISGHFSSFEIMAAVIVRAGVPCQITYRAMNNPYVDERVRASRYRYGVRMFAPKGLDGARELMRGLSRGESVALMNDQKFNGGVAAPLFGVLAHTAPPLSRSASGFRCSR